MFSSRKTAAPSSGYNLTKSLRFRHSASAWLNRTPGSASNQQKFTWSGWVKLGWFDLSYNPQFFGAATSTSNYFQFGWSSGNLGGTNAWSFGAQQSSGGSTYGISTAALFRDPSSWYHVVLAVDTTQSTASNRMILYVNGVQQVNDSSSIGQPPQNYNFLINSTITHGIGYANAYSNYLDGYLSEVNFIDGQALTPSSFGSTNALTGVWQPAKYTGTYGTNGFYLPFTNTTSTTTLGYDSSGNSNNWTVNNISLTAGSTYDSMTDVPTLTSATVANYCVLNPLSKGANVSATNGNLNAVISGGSAESLQSTLGMASGKWYCEMTAGGGGSIFGITTVGANLSSWVGSDTKGYGYRGDTGAVMYNSSALVSGMSTFASGDVISLAFDADTGKLWFAKNGTWYNSGSPSAGTNATVSSIASGTWFVSVGRIAATNDAQFNFGQQPFSYTPPTGFVALNTYNLPTSTIVKGASYMDINLYTGTSGSQSLTNAQAFQPSFVWLKSRSNATDHVVHDVLRGTAGIARLFPDSTAAESATGDGFLSINSNGFSLDSTGGGGDVNTTGRTYVAWQWAGPASGTSNTSGSITSTVSVNATAGFSVVTWVHSSTTSTIGHGLGVAPTFIILKSRTTAYNWDVGCTSIGWGNRLNLNTTVAAYSPAFWNSTAPTSTVFTYAGSGASNGDNMVAYCFTPIAGYSAFGSYTGNGSTDGPFVYLGFRPKYVMIKRTDFTGDWTVVDTSCNPYNYEGALLAPNTTAAETASTYYTGGVLDGLSNGFKIRNGSGPTNPAGGTCIYAAFAENPFKNALAR